MLSVAVLLVFLAGCLPPATPRPGGTLVVGTPDLPGLEARLLHAGLVSRDPWTQLLADGVAESWEISGDGLTWTFFLKPGVALADGTPLTSSIAAEHFLTLADTSVDWLWLDRVETPDERTVVFSFIQASPGTLERHADPPGGIDGAGPFILAERHEDRAVYRRSEEYRWGPSWSGNQGPAWLDGIVAVSIQDPVQGVEALAAGELHVLENLPAGLHGLARELPEVEILAGPELGLAYLAFRADRSPFDDVRVRRAVNLAIDRERLAELVGDGTHRPAYGLLPPAVAAALEDRDAHRHDLATAHLLLSEAGCQGESEYTLAVTDGRLMEAAGIVAEMLELAGLRVRVERVDPEALAAADWQLALLEYRWRDPDILEWLLVGSQSPHPNVSRWADPVLDLMLREAAAAPRPGERNDGYRDVQRYLIDLCVWAPLWHPVALTAVRADLVRGYAPGHYLDVWLSGVETR
ncbi:MAG: ABC transporter substrate-binding protein [bacterium]|nr:ABC transporter substrate-binding protein [bacterium]